METLHLVSLQHIRNEETALGDFSVKFVFIHRSERLLSKQDLVQENSSGPHVRLHAVVFALRADLWAHIGRCPAENLHLSCLLAGEPKIDQLHIWFQLISHVDHDVVGLEVPVRNV